MESNSSARKTTIKSAAWAIRIMPERLKSIST